MVDYLLRMKAIEEEHCVNKDKPELMCHGSCHVQSELAALEQDSPDENDPGVPPPYRLREWTPTQETELNTEVTLTEEESHWIVRFNCGRTLEVFSQLPTPPPRFA